MKLTKDEQMMVLLYGDGTRNGLIRSLKEMRQQLQTGEEELADLTDRLLKKLENMSDEVFTRL